MARKRHHSSKHGAYSHHSMPGHGVSHAADKFNDEYKHQKGSSAVDFNPGSAERHKEYYASADSRRRQELEDAGMIHEDHRAIANLPQEVMIKAYPMTGPYMPQGLNDTIEGIDRQMDYDDSKRKEHFFPKKI